MTAPVESPRYPLEPLAEAMHLSLAACCRQLGVSGSTQQQYRRDGVTEKVADRLAVKAGLHPFEVWPEMADDAVEAALVPCAWSKCEGTFIPEGRRRYCSNHCRWRDTTERRRQRPEVAEAMRAERRARRSEPSVREYENRQRRAYYRANREAELERQRAYDRRRKAP